MLGRRWSCQECKEEGLGKLRGCDGDTKVPLDYIDPERLSITKYPIFKCPVKLASGKPAWYLRIWQLCKLTNSLPEAGGVLDQRADLMSAFEVIEEEIGWINGKK